jgi:hypothetical protein
MTDSEEDVVNVEVEESIKAWDFGLDVYILPQPKDAKEYLKIPRLSRSCPFGYTIDEAEPDWLQPVPLELAAMEKARKYLKQYSYRQVAAWLTKVTGRYMSHVGLMKRIKSEQTIGRKSSTYRELARRYEKALKKAKEYEERIGKSSDDFFNSDRYRAIEQSFSNDT